MKSLVSVASLLTAISAFALTPTVSNVTISQDDARKVHVAYTLAGAPAIVTVDLYTNGVCISKLVSTVSGDGNCLVAANGSHEMVWKVRKDWPDRTTKLADAVRAEVRAYHPSNPPDVIVMNLAENSDPKVNYYASYDSLPGGLESDAYRTTRLALRKCPVKYRTYQVGVPLEIMGRNTYEDTDLYSVTFTNDHYLGVFETTQAQWNEVMGWKHRDWVFMSLDNDNWKVRPVNHVGMLELREGSVECDKLDQYDAVKAYRYPHSPNPDSFFGKLYARTGLRCDLPSRAQWAVAAMADQYYGVDGQPITNATHIAAANEVGRNKYNGGNYYIAGKYVVPGEEGTESKGIDLQYGTARVGSYRPNPWGFYDMYGNVAEGTLDPRQGKGMSNVHDAFGEPFVAGPDYDYKGDGKGYCSLGGSWNGGSGNGIQQGGTALLYSNNRHNGFRVMYRVNQAAFYSDL